MPKRNLVIMLHHLIEHLIKSTLKSLLDNNQAELEFYLKLSDMKFKTKVAKLDHMHKVLDNSFIVMSYEEAFGIVHRSNEKFQTAPKKSEGLGKEHELYLVEKHCNNVPVFVIDWPKELKAFYARKIDDNLVSACDLLFPSVGELCGGALRENDHESLKFNIESLKIQGLDWYLDMRASGAAPMGGFGLGFERLIQFILKTQNIRDTIPFSRRPHDCKL